MTRRASISKEVNRLLRIGIKRVHGFASRMRAMGSQSCMTCSANGQADHVDSEWIRSLGFNVPPCSHETFNGVTDL